MDIILIYIVFLFFWNFSYIAIKKVVHTTYLQMKSLPVKISSF